MVAWTKVTADEVVKNSFLKVESTRLAEILNVNCVREKVCWHGQLENGVSKEDNQELAFPDVVFMMLISYHK